MFIVQVQVHVKAGLVEAFREATLQNASQSIRERGIDRFDVVQQLDDPTRFLLVEVYRRPEDADRHKETAHYKTWRNRVADMMAEPRQGVKYTNVFPTDERWG
jgi:autoinducer 2-degrading protein